MSCMNILDECSLLRVGCYSCKLDLNEMGLKSTRLRDTQEVTSGEFNGKNVLDGVAHNRWSGSVRLGEQALHG